jgi:hypothetical protein
MVIDQSQVTPESPEFVRNRVAMQDRYMEDIWEKFDGMVRSILPLFETEVRGVPMLDRLAASLFER